PMLVNAARQGRVDRSKKARTRDDPTGPGSESAFSLNWITSRLPTNHQQPPSFHDDRSRPGEIRKGLDNPAPNLEAAPRVRYPSLFSMEPALLKELTHTFQKSGRLGCASGRRTDSGDRR